MNALAKRIINTYLVLMLTNTLAASFIWGVNTLFLLDAGLTNTQAFIVNAFFTVGMVLFEVPTGVVADAKGRRVSYIFGTLTLIGSTLIYLWAWKVAAGMVLWCFASILLGLGFTFFSGATEAWVVDALKFAKYKGKLESVFAKGQIMFGIAMLGGSVAGGFIAQYTNLGIPYIIRVLILGINFIVAYLFMQDLGFRPVKDKNAFIAMKHLLKASIDHGLKKPAIRWLMIAAPFGAGVGAYSFYAMQPYLLELFGNSEAYGIAGAAAAIVAGAQIVGGMLVPKLKICIQEKTTVFALSIIINLGLLVFIGITKNFYVAIVLLVVWALVFASNMPLRQAYLNKLIPSKQRATVLSFDALMGSSGGVVFQPALGKVADVYSYGFSFIVAGVIQLIGLPFILLSKKQKSKADNLE